MARTPYAKSPRAVEAGGASAYSPAKRGLWTRARLVAVGGGGGGARSGLVRRGLVVGLFFALIVLVYHRDSGLNIVRPDAHRGSSDNDDWEPPSFPNVHAGSGHHDVLEDETTTSTTVAPVKKPSKQTPSASSLHGQGPAAVLGADIKLPVPQDYSPFYGGKSRRPIDISSDPLPVTASLQERLNVWRNAPGGRGAIDGEVELGKFVQWNLEKCTTISEQHNTHMIQKSANVWASMDRAIVHQKRMELINHMETLVGSQELKDVGEGRGIVMVAGNVDTLMRVKWSVQMLRSYGSQLPVQVYHFPSEAPNPDDEIIQQLADLNVTLVSAVGQKKDPKHNKSYHLKAIAVIQCPWREVLYLDSDSVPARDPEYMFKAPGYERLGIFCTPDYWKTSGNSPMWAIAGVKCRDEWEMETGQMFIDKARHLDVFYLIKYMLYNHHYWFYFSDGDKDIFRWAMLMLRKRWAVPGRWVAAGGLPGGTLSGDFCALSMIQHDAWGVPLFVHYNLMKTVPSGIGLGFSWGRSKQLPLFNTWPATPSTARLGEPRIRPQDGDKPGLGDVDCDMLADADEYGYARAPAQEMIMRRAVRERGVKAKYHGGSLSALCIDLDYVDVRSEERIKEDEKYRESFNTTAVDDAIAQWQEAVDEAKRAGEPEPPRPYSVIPDWTSPVELWGWHNDPDMHAFENKIYGLGFVPNGHGF